MPGRLVRSKFSCITFRIGGQTMVEQPCGMVRWGFRIPLVRILGMSAAIRGVVRRLPPADPPPDADLVTAFAARRDAEAFAALVARHGPTVLGVCQRVLGDAHDAEDAFQAVFLVLARKVKAVRPPGAVGGWLYGVAVRTANKARVAAARRRRREMIAAQAQANPDREGGGGVELAELRAALDEELAKFPETLRAVVVLCDLHGRTRSEAATELGCPEGTVAARLHRARKKLGEALARRGLALPAAGLAAVLVPASVSAAAIRSTVAAVLGTARPVVLALAREVTRSMSATTHAIALGAITLLAGRPARRRQPVAGRSVSGFATITSTGRGQGRSTGSGEADESLERNEGARSTWLAGRFGGLLR